MNSPTIKKSIGFFMAAIILAILYPIVFGGASLSFILYRCFLTVFIGFGVLYFIYWALDKLGEN